MRVLLLSLLLFLPASVSADPVDLLDPTSRWVEIAFEVSPRDQPGQVDTRYTPKVRAWLEAGDDGRIRVTVDRGDVERILLADDDPVAGSFSDFVWVFDAETGEVLSASMSGEIVKTLDWGLFDSEVRTAIEVDMTTRSRVGFKPSRRWMGQEFFGSCRADDEARCTQVPASVYDPERGYVNAVGDLRVRFGEVELATFSPLGEAKLYEVDAPTAPIPAQRAAIPALGSAFTGADAAPAVWVDLPAVSSGPPTHR